MGLVPVPFAGPGLVTVPGFGVHRRYGPISGHTPRYPPSAFPVRVRFHILARNHSQQTYCVGLFGVQLYVLHPFDQRQPVGDQTVDQFRSAVGIGPVTGRFRLRFVVMGPPAPGRLPAGIRRRQRLICDEIIVTVSPVATASCRMVESNARRPLFANTPQAATTSRTASKIRSGRSLALSLARHNVSTVGWNPPSVNDRPAAAFQAMSRRSRWTASRSDRPSNAWRTITAPITEPGIDGRPRGPNKSPNISAGNRRRRCSAKN